MKKSIKNNKPFRIYYDTNITKINDAVESIIKTVGYWSHFDLINKMYLQNNKTIKWKCYICKCEIDIDYKKFKNKDIFCESHKPKYFTNQHKNDIGIIRYINSFYTHIKDKIENNSKLKIYD